MADKKKAVKVAGSLVALAFSGLVLFAMFGPEGCGPTEEEKQILFTLNNHQEVVDKGGHVEKFTVQEDDDGDEEGVYRFDAEILNSDGVAIGRIRSLRVEGFGTMKPRVMWYKTPGVSEEWPQRGDRGRRGEGRRGDRDRGRGDRPPQ